MLIPDLEIDIKEAAIKFDRLLDRRKRVRVMIATRTAGANEIRKQALKTSKRYTKVKIDKSGWHTKGVGFADKTGTLRDSLRVAGKPVKRVGKWGYVYVAAGLGNQPSPHSGLIEFGHEGPRPSPPHPFMETAAVEAAANALRVSAKKFIAEIDKQMTKK